MKILIDECVPHIVKKGLPQYDIRTVQELGWSGIKNGELLKLAATEFDIFITSDKNLQHQQNLGSHKFGVILLPSNQVPVIKSLLPQIAEMIRKIGPGDFVNI